MHLDLRLESFRVLRFACLERLESDRPPTCCVSKGAFGFAIWDVSCTSFPPQDAQTPPGISQVVRQFFGEPQPSSAPATQTAEESLPATLDMREAPVTPRASASTQDQMWKHSPNQDMIQRVASATRWLVHRATHSACNLTGSRRRDAGEAHDEAERQEGRRAHQRFQGERPPMQCQAAKRQSVDHTFRRRAVAGLSYSLDCHVSRGLFALLGKRAKC